MRQCHDISSISSLPLLCQSSLRTLCPFLFFPFHSFWEVDGVQKSLAFFEPGYFCFLVSVVRCVLAFKLPIPTPPCNCDIVCGPEHSWLQDSCVLSMPGLVVCNPLWLSQSIWGCWVPLCLAGLSKKVSWAKAVVPALCSSRLACKQAEMSSVALPVPWFGRDVLQRDHLTIPWKFRAHFRRDTAGVSMGTPLQKRKWMEKYEWRGQLLCWPEYSLR